MGSRSGKGDADSGFTYLSSLDAKRADICRLDHVITTSISAAESSAHRCGVDGSRYANVPKCEQLGVWTSEIPKVA